MNRALLVAILCAVVVLGGCYNEIMPQHPSERDGLVPIAGAANVRDLGGHVGHNGRTIRYGLVIRSGELSLLSQRDMARFADMGIRYVVDFRGGSFHSQLVFVDGNDLEVYGFESERTHAPSRLWDGAIIWDERPNAPLADNTGIPETIVIPDYEDIIRGMPGFDTIPEVIAYVTNRYRFLVTMPGTDWAGTDMPRDQYLSFFRALLASDGTPLLLHCSAGKDRAGVATALLFLALGVSEQDIIDNYMISYDAVRERFFPVVPMIRQSVADDMRNMQPGAIRLARALEDVAGNEEATAQVLAQVRADVTRSVLQGTMQSIFLGMIQDDGYPINQATVGLARQRAQGAYNAGHLNTSINWALELARAGMIDLAGMYEDEIVASANSSGARIAPLLLVHREWIEAALNEVRRLGDGDINNGIVVFLNSVNDDMTGVQVRDRLREIFLEG